MDEPPCYVFRKRRDRLSKRRRLNDAFREEDVRRRHEIFEKTWQAQESKLNEAIRASNEKSLEEIIRFLDLANPLRQKGKIPTALVVTGPTVPTGFFRELESHVTENTNDLLVTLRPGDGRNLKNMLKSLVGQVSQQHFDELEDDVVVTNQTQHPKPLAYDLKVVQDWVRKHGINHVVLNIERSETFDINVFSDFISLLHAWLDRIPFVLLIGVTTSIDIFQERLPRNIIKRMKGESIDIAESNNGGMIETAFQCCSASHGARVHLGPEVAASIMQRNQDHIAGFEIFRQSVKYAYLCHFHGNAASIFCAEPASLQDFGALTLEALRHLPSFQRYIENLIEANHALHAKILLSDNDLLLTDLRTSIQNAQVLLEWLCGAISIIQTIQAISPTTFAHSIKPQKSNPTFSTLYIKALSGTLTPTSPLIRDLLLTIRRLPSEPLYSILDSIIDVLMSMPPSNRTDISPDSFLDIQSEVSELTVEHGSVRPTETSTVMTETVRTTLLPNRTTPIKKNQTISVTSNSVHHPSPASSSKVAAGAREVKTAATQYTNLLSRFTQLLTSYFNATLPLSHYALFPFPPISSSSSSHPPAANESEESDDEMSESASKPTWFPHEIILLNTKSLHVGAFTPAPRAAIERALSRPADYLGDDSHVPNETEAQADDANDNDDEDVIDDNEVEDEDEDGDNQAQRTNENSSGQRKDKRRHKLPAPATAILYQLYTESGSLVNVADLWVAFRARIVPFMSNNGLPDERVNGINGKGGETNGIVSGKKVNEQSMEKGEKTAKEGENQEQVLRALFARALAELKYLGFIKQSRRKVDCVQKVLWAGI